MFKVIECARTASVCFLFVALTLFVLAQPVIAQIAPGVLQSAARTAIITGTVVQSDGTPVRDADVKLVGQAILSTKSDDHGAFVFTSVPWGTYQIIVTSKLGTASRGDVTVNGDVSVVVAYQAQSALQTIAHVSTHSAGANINVSPASIASVAPSDYAFKGNTSWQQFLNQIPGVTVGGGLESGYSCAVSIPGGPFQPIILSINGALPYETSVTLDGMSLQNVSPAARLLFGAPGLGTDVSFLPLAIFDTADVVRGPGANSPSIANSIGGSFVLHPPSLVTGNHYEFSASNDAYGGIVSNAKVALQLGRLSAIVTYGVNDSPGPLGENANIITAWSWWPITINGQSVVGGGFAGTSLTPPNTLHNSTLYCCMSYSTAWTQHNGAASFSYAVTPKITAQLFYAGSSTQSELPEAMRPATFTPFGAGYTGSIAPGTYNLISYDQAGPLNKSESLLEEKVTAYVGAGVLRFAALQNNSFYQGGFSHLLPNGNYKMYGTIEYSAAPTTPVNFNGSNENLAFIPYTYATSFWTNNRDLLGSYAVQLGSKSDLGISYVTSYYNAPSFFNELLDGSPSSGQQSSAVSETTNELRLNATMQLSDVFSVGGSWYFTRGSYHVTEPTNPDQWVNASFPYSAPRLSAVWRATRDVAVRMSAGGGYALPPLTYLVGTNSVTLPCTTICNENVTNLNLKPEESFGFDLGTDVRLKRNTVLSADVYRTNLFGQFYQSSTAHGTYSGLPLYIDQYGNLSQSRYEGINLDIRHDVPHGFYWHAAVGLTRAYVVNVPAGFYNGVLPYTSVPCTKCVNTTVLPGINFNGAFESPVPYADGTATLGYRWGPQKFVDLSPTYYGNGNPYFEPAFVEFDAHLGYPLTRNVTLFATFQNITGINDANFQTQLVTGMIPNIAGANPVATSYPYVFPTTFFSIPYGPRTVIVTVNFKT